MNDAINDVPTEEQVGTIQRAKNISARKLSVVQTASFDTIIEALKGKSESAQCTFMYRYIKEMDDEVLATSMSYLDLEIRARASKSSTSPDAEDTKLRA